MDGDRGGVWIQPNQFKGAGTKRRGNGRYQSEFLMLVECRKQFYSAHWP